MTSETFQKPEIFVADDSLKTIFDKAFSKSGLKVGKHGWRKIKSWNNFYCHNIAPLFTAWTFEDLTKQKVQSFFQKAAVKNRDTFFIFFKESDLQARDIAERMTWFNIRNEKRFYLIEVNEEKDEELFTERFLLRLNAIDDDCHIIDSYWDWSNNILTVVSLTLKGFKRFHIPLANLPSLNKQTKTSLENMEIDEDGIFIYWPKIDVHLGWDQFQAAIDQKALLKAKQKSDEFNKRYGIAIRNLRHEQGLRQNDIKGLTGRQVGRVERGECRATHTALVKLAKTHEMDISEYMDKLSKLL